jgi:hypothetical protein
MIYSNLNSLPIGKHNPNFERANFFRDDTSFLSINRTVPFLLDVKNQFTEPKYCKPDPGDFIFYRLYRVMLAKSIRD